MSLRPRRNGPPPRQARPRRAVIGGAGQGGAIPPLQPNSAPSAPVHDEWQLKHLVRNHIQLRYIDISHTIKAGIKRPHVMGKLEEEVTPTT